VTSTAYVAALNDAQRCRQARRFLPLPAHQVHGFEPPRCLLGREAVDAAQEIRHG
jgi:hypothetical protein